MSALALACACLAAPGAHAQDIGGLRGTIADEDTDQPAADPRGEASGAATPRPRARPRTQAESLAAEEPGSGEAAAARIGVDNQRVGAVERRAAPAESDPFAPLGIRAGAFLLRPQLEQGIGWTSNSANATGGRPSTFSETRLRLDAESDWSRHRASFSVDGSYRRSLSGERIDEVEGGAAGRIDFDLAGELAAFVAGGYRVDPESASTPGAVTAAVEQPLRHTFDASAGVSKDAGPLRFGLTGALIRQTFDDAELADGSTVSQRDRDSTLAMARLRAGYAVSPALAPFVEAEIGRRLHDRERDAAGYARSADHYALRAGVALDLGEKLNGEVAAGWLTERPDDPRLSDISGLSLAANLRWSPVRGTVVALTAATAVEGATAPGDSGSLLHSGSVSVERDLRANLTGRAAAGLDWRDYSGGGHDIVMRGEADLTWWMNRNAGITARARHEVQESTRPGRDWDATSVWLGMTLRR